MIEVVYKSCVHCRHHPHVGFLYSFSVLVFGINKYPVVCFVAPEYAIRDLTEEFEKLAKEGKLPENVNVYLHEAWKEIEGMESCTDYGVRYLAYWSETIDCRKYVVEALRKDLRAETMETEGVCRCLLLHY